MPGDQISPETALLFERHKDKRDDAIAEAKSQMVKALDRKSGRTFEHIPVGAPLNPKQFPICARPTTGEDALEAGHYYCHNVAGKETDHPRFGACKGHGGRNPVGPDNASFIHGRQATVFHSVLRQKFKEAAASDENPLNLLPELEAQKELFFMGLDKLEAQWNGEDVNNPLDIEIVRLLGNDLFSSASKIVNMRHQTALTNSEIILLQLTLGDFIDRFVASSERADSVAWLMERIPFSVEGEVHALEGAAEGDRL